MTTLPPIPSDWHAHTQVVIEPGYQPRAVVLHDAQPGSYHPFVIHTAYVNSNDQWAYENGDYFFTKEEAMDRFKVRAQRITGIVVA